jgi:hypothetical protein
VSAALKNLYRWIYVMQQVHEARWYVERAMAIGHPEQFQTLAGIREFLAYFRGALISYAKCFVSAGPGKMRLNESHFLGADSEQLTKHLKLMELRDKYVAHCDDNEIEDAVLVHEEDNPTELVVRLQYKFSFPFDRLYQLRDLLERLDSYVANRQSEHVKSIEKSLGKSVRVWAELSNRARGVE